jgi:ribosome recycling factor
MDPQLQGCLTQVEEQMKKAISHLELELQKIRAGKATPSLVDSVMVDYYGNATPLSQVANVSTADARTLIVQPWEKSMLTPIEKAIQVANLGLNPQNDGIVIRINVPPLTEERRKELVKKAKAEAEHCKVTLRNARKDGNEAVRKLVKGGVPEDMGKAAETKIQTLTDNYSAVADKHIGAKEKEIMTV